MTKFISAFVSPSLRHRLKIRSFQFNKLTSCSILVVMILITPVRTEANCLQAYATAPDVAWRAEGMTLGTGLHRRCANKTKELFNAYPSEDGFYLPDWVIEDALRGERPDGFQAVIGYTDACLPAINEIVTPGGVFERFLEDIRQHFVVVYESDSKAFKCNGAIVGRHIVTARHCLADIFMGENDRGRDTNYPAGRFFCTGYQMQLKHYQFVRFDSVFNEEKVLVELDTSIAPDLYSNEPDLVCLDGGPLSGGVVAENDWVALKMVDASQIPKSRPFHATYGYHSSGMLLTNKYLEVEHLVGVGGLEGTSRSLIAKASLMFDLQPLCRVIHGSAKAFVHGCSTEETGSGAPFIQFERVFGIDGQQAIIWKIAGLNTGPFTQEMLCGENSISIAGDGYVVNGAVYLPPLLDELSAHRVD